MFAKIANINNYVLPLLRLTTMTELGFGAYATHPGDVIKDEIESRGITQRMLAERTGIGFTVINEILNGKRPLTERSALLIGAALDIDSEPLLRLQYKYNMQTLMKDQSFLKRLKSIKGFAASVTL